MVSDALLGFPLTTDLSAWHAHATFLLLGFVMALSIYAFRTSLGARVAFKDLLGEA
jgi:hypothetical protein